MVVIASCDNSQNNKKEEYAKVKDQIIKTSLLDSLEWYVYERDYNINSSESKICIIQDCRDPNSECIPIIKCELKVSTRAST